jgi:hypothetical protein
MMKPAPSLPEVSKEKRVEHFLQQIDTIFRPVLDDDEYYSLTLHLSEKWVGLFNFFIHRILSDYVSQNLSNNSRMNFTG